MFLKLLIGFLYCKCVYSSSCEINVGTVLFTKADQQKSCWNKEELALLHARSVFQDILPKTTTMENDEYVTALINYFHLTIEKTRSMTSGRMKTINMMALFDTIGGYLHSIALPLSNNAYYLGKISFDSAHQIYYLYSQLKTYLETDGLTWTAPKKITKRSKTEASPLDDTYNDIKAPCTHIVYINDSCGSMKIPMPYFDSVIKPTAIAVPLYEHPLRNMKTKSSAYVLCRYYRTAMACLKCKDAKSEDIKKFKSDLQQFLNKNVMKHLNDEELYAAFGAVYRLQKSLGESSEISSESNNTSEAEEESSEKSTDLASGMMETEQKAGKMSKEEEIEEDVSFRIESIAAGVVILLWVIIALLYCLYRLTKKSRDKDRHMYKEDDKTPIYANQNENYKQSPKSRSKESANRPSSSKRDSISGKEPLTPKKETMSRKDSASKKESTPKTVALAKKDSKQKKEKAKKDAAIKKECKSMKNANKKCIAACTEPCAHFLQIQTNFDRLEKEYEHHSSGLKSSKSVPLSLMTNLKRGVSFVKEANRLNTSTEATRATDKAVVFGYDFETSSNSSDSSLADASEISSGLTTPRRQTSKAT